MPSWWWLTASIVNKLFFVALVVLVLFPCIDLYYWVYGVKILSKLFELNPNPRALFAKFFGEKIPAYHGTGPSDPEPVVPIALLILYYLFPCDLPLECYYIWIYVIFNLLPYYYYFWALFKKALSVVVILTNLEFRPPSCIPLLPAAPVGELIV